MLAISKPMPPPASYPESHEQSSLTTMTTSLAILPSPSLRDCSQPTTSPKRPKLSLNTCNVSSFGGKTATSLRLDTLSAVSPTVRNTFSNGYEAPNSHFSPPSSASSLSTDSSDSSSSQGNVIPYTLPYNVTSILSNSPIQSLRPKMSRPFFPAQKRVAFRTPLEEEIQTTKYTASHQDLLLEEALDTASRPDNTSSGDEPADASNESAADEATTTAPRRRGAKRDSWSDDDDSDSAPETPVASRSKRRRNWVWTLPDPPRQTPDGLEAAS